MVEKLYRVKEISEAFGCSESFTYKLIQTKRIKAFRAPMTEGARKSIVRVPESELKRFIEENSN